MRGSGELAANTASPARGGALAGWLVGLLFGLGPLGAAAAGEEPPPAEQVHATYELVAFLLLALVPLSVLAIRWVTQRRIQHLMNADADVAPQHPAFRRHDAADELRAAVQPRFQLHDARHGNADAAAVREGFVARSLALFRRAVLDPSIWRHRFPLMSWRTAGFMLLVAVIGFFTLGALLNQPRLEDFAYTVTAVLLSGLLVVYAVVTQQLLRRDFVRSRAQLARVLDRLEQRPRDIDLSFRPIEAMCHDDTCQIAVDEFASRSQALLMDLRGFSKDRKGCQVEVDYLLDTVPLPQVLFLVDAGGDHALVQQMILERWEFLSPDSPNLHDRAPVVHPYVAAASDEADVQGILDLLMRAARAGSLAERARAGHGGDAAAGSLTRAGRCRTARDPRRPRVRRRDGARRRRGAPRSAPRHASARAG